MSDVIPFPPRPPPTPLPFRLGGWGTIVADPPWSFDDKGTRLAPEECAAGYQTMSDTEILALPVSTLPAEDAHLYLWSTDAHLELALRCVRMWGFEYKQLLVWRKVDSAGRPRLGGGHYFRHTFEVLLFAVRGSRAFPRHDLAAEFEAPRGAHSAKPDRFYQLVESVSPGPRIELFARRARPGWTIWGDQAPLAEVRPISSASLALQGEG